MVVVVGVGFCGGRSLVGVLGYRVGVGGWREL